MTLPKGYARLSIKKSVDARVQKVKARMIQEEPDKYDERTSYSDILTWMLDRLL